VIFKIFIYPSVLSSSFFWILSYLINLVNDKCEQIFSCKNDFCQSCIMKSAKNRFVYLQRNSSNFCLLHCF
jgi:hypothetical protein